MRHHWPLVVILAVFAGAVALEVGWGLPGTRRVELLFPGGLTDERVAEIAARSRGKLTSQEDLPIPLHGGTPEAPVYDRDAALDACRRFLLYSDNPDEMLTLWALSRMQPSRMQLDPGMGQYGGAFLYPLGAWLKAASLTPLVTEGDLAFYLRRPDQFARLYVAGRLFVALCVAVGIATLYSIGLRLGGVAAATAAAGLLALCPALLTWSVVLKPHAAAILPVALALRWSLAYYETPRRRYLAGAAIAAGAAGAMTAVAAPILLMPITAALLEKRGPGSRTLRSIACPVLAAVAFLALNPYHLVRLGDRLDEAAHVRDFYAGHVSAWQPLAFLAGPAREALGAPILALAVAAMVFLLIRQTRRALILAVPAAITFIGVPLALGPWAGQPQSARFALPALPIMALAVGWFLDQAGARARRAVPALLVLMLALSLPTLYAHLASSLGRNPRYDAGERLSTIPDAPLVVQFPAAPYRNPTVNYLRREVLYARDASRACVSARATWHASPNQDEGNRGNRRLVFSLKDRPRWLRAPLTFADRDIVLEFHPAAAPAEPEPTPP